MRTTWIIILIVLLFAGCNKDEEEAGGSFHKQGSGATAEAFLRSDDYTRLLVEIQYEEGYKPTQRALDSFKVFLQERIHKPSGIDFRYNKISVEKNGPYSVNDITEIEDNHRQHFNQGDRLAAYFFFAGKHSSQNTDNSQVLGIAYRNTSMVIFEKTIQENSDGQSEPDRHVLEEAVINHEAGHNLGLVNNGTSMQSDHQDSDHGKHCDNDNCLMHYTVQTGGFFSNIIDGGTVPELDSRCLNDLQANGGK